MKTLFWYFHLVTIFRIIQDTEKGSQRYQNNMHHDLGIGTVNALLESNTNLYVAWTFFSTRETFHPFIEAKMAIPRGVTRKKHSGCWLFMNIHRLQNEYTTNAEFQQIIMIAFSLTSALAYVTEHLLSAFAYKFQRPITFTICIHSSYTLLVVHFLQHNSL